MQLYRHHSQSIFTLRFCYILIWAIMIASPSHGSPEKSGLKPHQPPFTVTRFHIPLARDRHHIDCSYTKSFKLNVERLREELKELGPLATKAANNLLKLQGKSNLKYRNEMLINVNPINLFKKRNIYDWVEHVFPAEAEQVKKMLLKQRDSIRRTVQRAEIFAKQFLTTSLYDEKSPSRDHVRVVSKDGSLIFQRNKDEVEARYNDFTNAFTKEILRTLPVDHRIYFEQLLSVYKKFQNLIIALKIYSLSDNACGILKSQREYKQMKEQGTLSQDEEERQFLPSLSTLKSVFLKKEIPLPLKEGYNLDCSAAIQTRQSAFKLDQRIYEKSEVVVQHLNKLLQLQGKPNLPIDLEADVLNRPFNLFSRIMYNAWQDRLLPVNTDRMQQVLTDYHMAMATPSTYQNHMVRILRDSKQHHSVGRKDDGFLFERNGSQFIAQYLSPNALFTDEFLAELNNEELRKEFRALLTTYDEYLNEWIERSFYMAHYSVCQSNK